MSKEEKKLRVESEHAQFVAKCIYEKAREKAFNINVRRGPLIKALYLDDLASILDQLPITEKQEYKSDNALRADGTGQLGELEEAHTEAFSAAMANGRQVIILKSELSALKAENEKLKEFERKRWESAVGTLGITPPKPEEV